MDERNYQNMKVEFVKGATGSESLIADDVRQIVFAGRSNVGKSSTINALVKRTIARSSSTPGKTREMNYYSWTVEGNKVYLVDLPGYGYARMSKEDREHMLKRTFYYLSNYAPLILVVVIVIDSKVGITELDREFIELIPQEVPVLIASNKSDKLNQKERSLQEKKLIQEGYEHRFISASTGKGIDNLRDLLWKGENK